MSEELTRERRQEACRRWRAKNLQYERERNRLYAEEHREARREYQRQYNKTERARELDRERKRKNRREKQAQKAVANAIQSGQLERASACWYCGSPQNIEAHHVDYDSPLSVVWLCRGCHYRAHKEHRDMELK